MVKANVDRIVEYLRQKKSVSLGDLSKALSLPKEDIQKSAEYMEDDGIVKIDYKLTTPYITLVKDPEAKTETPSLSQEAKKPDIMQPGNKPNLQSIPVPQIKTDALASQQKKQSSQDEKFPFLLNEPLEKKEPSLFIPKPDENLSASLAVMQQPPEEVNLPKVEVPDINPLEDRPTFDLNPPSPDEKEEKPDKEYKPSLAYSEDFSEQKKVSYPEYTETALDKIDFLLDQLNDKVTNHDYKDLNVFYRKIYNMYREADDLSPNERYLIGEKINSVFQRVKRTYLIEEAV